MITHAELSTKPGTSNPVINKADMLQHEEAVFKEVCTKADYEREKIQGVVDFSYKASAWALRLEDCYEFERSLVGIVNPRAAYGRTEGPAAGRTGGRAALGWTSMGSSGLCPSPFLLSYGTLFSKYRSSDLVNFTASLCVW